MLGEGQDVVAQSLSSSILPDRLGQFAPRRSRKPCQLLHLRQAWQYRCAPLLCQPRKLIGLGQGGCGLEKLEEVEQFDIWRLPGEIRSEERRVGTESGLTGGIRWCTYN